MWQQAVREASWHQLLRLLTFVYNTWATCFLCMQFVWYFQNGHEAVECFISSIVTVSIILFGIQHDLVFYGWCDKSVARWFHITYFAHGWQPNSVLISFSRPTSSVRVSTLFCLRSDMSQSAVNGINENGKANVRQLRWDRREQGARQTKK